MIPSYQQMQDPLLRILAASDSPLAMKDVASAISDHFGLSELEQSELMPNKRRTYVSDRAVWATTYLAKAGLVVRPKRGVVEITERGRQVVQALKPGETITNEVLKQFDEFRDFLTRSNADDAAPAASTSGGTLEVTAAVAGAPDSAETPDARIAQAVEELSEALGEQLLERVRTMDAARFEHLVVDLLVRMGYGGSREDAGRVIGGSGDGGVDGIIKEDRLGLDNIYVQAKRWKAGNTVGRPDVQQFMGALVGKGSRKGIFITASSFSSGCHEFVRDKDVSIVLIDGQELVALMIEHGVGVETRDTVVIQDLDDDYFDQ